MCTNACTSMKNGTLLLFTTFCILLYWKGIHLPVCDMPKNQFFRFHDVLCTVIYLLEYSILFPMGTPVPISVLYHDFVLNKFIQTINWPVISHEYYRTHIMNKLGTDLIGDRHYCNHNTVRQCYLCTCTPIATNVSNSIFGNDFSDRQLGKA